MPTEFCPPTNFLQLPGVGPTGIGAHAPKDQVMDSACTDNREGSEVLGNCDVKSCLSAAIAHSDRVREHCLHRSVCSCLRFHLSQSVFSKLPLPEGTIDASESPRTVPSNSVSSCKDRVIDKCERIPAQISDAGSSASFVPIVKTEAPQQQQRQTSSIQFSPSRPFYQTLASLIGGRSCYVEDVAKIKAEMEFDTADVSTVKGSSDDGDRGLLDDLANCRDSVTTPVPFTRQTSRGSARGKVERVPLTRQRSRASEDGAQNSEESDDADTSNGVFVIDEDKVPTYDPSTVDMARIYLCQRASRKRSWQYHYTVNGTRTTVTFPESRHRNIDRCRDLAIFAKEMHKTRDVVRFVLKGSAVSQQATTATCKDREDESPSHPAEDVLLDGEDAREYANSLPRVPGVRYSVNRGRGAWVYHFTDRGRALSRTFSLATYGSKAREICLKAKMDREGSGSVPSTVWDVPPHPTSKSTPQQYQQSIPDKSPSSARKRRQETPQSEQPAKRQARSPLVTAAVDAVAPAVAACKEEVHAPLLEAAVIPQSRIGKPTRFLNRQHPTTLFAWNLVRVEVGNTFDWIGEYLAADLHDYGFDLIDGAADQMVVDVHRLLELL